MRWLKFENINLYGICIGVGLLACFGVLYWFSKIRKVDSRFVDFVFYDGVASIAIGFFFAALFQAFYNYLDNPEKGFRFGSGITFIGGLIGGVACFLIVYAILRKRFKTKLFQVLSMPPCAILIAHAFGRVGCFFAGCCYGKETDSFLGVQFPDLPHPVHATQLYEAAFLFILFAICFYLLMKKDFKHNMSVYLICYGIFRFCIEFLRDDSRGALVGGISPSQFWSIIMVVAGVGLIFLVEWLYKKSPQEKIQQTEEETKEIEE